ncbi:tyrosine-type recombinase/integrase [Candidatus Poribacteria bacterium]|nr:tyrosine-type recombinase/integrase [Candidatus Poribacteria bacterium]
MYSVPIPATMRVMDTTKTADRHPEAAPNTTKLDVLEAAIGALPAGRYTDRWGVPGLSLIVQPDTTRGPGSRSWSVRFGLPNGARKTVGLGAWPTVTAAEAVGTAEDAKREAWLIHEAETARGEMPELTAEQQAALELLAAAADAAPTPGTFAAAARDRHRVSMGSGRWRNPDEAGREWLVSLERHAVALWAMPLDEIKRRHVVECLQPLWTRRRPTAQKVLARIAEVFDFAVDRELVAANPARGAHRSMVGTKHRVQHHKSIPPSEVSAALARLDDGQTTATVRACMAFVVLTACRSKEAREARWSEIDFDAATWAIPGERMKSGEPHVVPLSRQALAALREAKSWRDASGYVFPSPNNTPAAEGKPLGDKTLRRSWQDSVGVGGTVHGLRSSFGEWAFETYRASTNTIDLCLAHKVGSVVTRSYVRTDRLDERRELMQAWADYLDAC